VDIDSRTIEEVMSNLAIKQFANDQAVSIAPFAEHTFLLSDLWV
jgi:hypothetical protein